MPDKKLSPTAATVLASMMLGMDTGLDSFGTLVRRPEEFGTDEDALAGDFRAVAGDFRAVLGEPAPKGRDRSRKGRRGPLRRR